MVLRILAIASPILLIGCGEQPASVESNDEIQARGGKEIYSNSCSICHGPDGTLGVGGAKDLSVSEMDSTGIMKIIKNGKGAMPPQGAAFNNDEELGNIVEYVQSLRK